MSERNLKMPAQIICPIATLKLVLRYTVYTKIGFEFEHHTHLKKNYWRDYAIDWAHTYMKNRNRTRSFLKIINKKKLPGPYYT